MRYFITIFLIAPSLSAESFDTLRNVNGKEIEPETAFNVLREESARLGISMDEHFHNCFRGTESEQELFSSAETEAMMAELSEHLQGRFSECPFKTKDDLQNELPKYLPRVWAKKVLVDRTVEKLDAESMKFVRNLWDEALRMAVGACHLSRYNMDYSIVSGKALSKMWKDYRSLSQATKDNLEKVTCWYTKFRIYDGENTLLPVILEAVGEYRKMGHSEL